MADNFCGPSNALQNFQKHSSVDRTLQQDRLSARQSPSQGFRSSPGLSTSLLESDFEGFQAGKLPQQQFEPPGFQQHGFSHATPNLSQTGPSNWANDFQRLSIFSPPPPQIQPLLTSQSHQRHDTGGWHQDFARQQQNFSAQSSTSQLQHNFQPHHPYGFDPMAAMSAAPRVAEYMENSSAEQTQQASEVFDEEAFARAFDEASKAEMQGHKNLSENHTRGLGQEWNMELEQDILIDRSAERLLETDPVIEHRLGADLIYDPTQNMQEQKSQNDPDALARTAAQLLDSVSNNTSEKFQNSQFLELMRQFRDREAVVEGDKIVGASGDGLHETLKNEMMTLSNTLKRISLDRDRPLKRSDIKRLLNINDTFLSLSSLYQQLVHSQNAVRFVQESRIQRTLSAMAENPAIQAIPMIHQEVLNFLSIFNKLATGPLSTQEIDTIVQRGTAQTEACKNYDLQLQGELHTSGHGPHQR